MLSFSSTCNGHTQMEFLLCEEAISSLYKQIQFWRIPIKSYMYFLASKVLKLMWEFLFSFFESSHALKHTLGFTFCAPWVLDLSQLQDAHTSLRLVLLQVSSCKWWQVIKSSYHKAQRGQALNRFFEIRKGRWLTENSAMGWKDELRNCWLIIAVSDIFHQLVIFGEV